MSHITAQASRRTRLVRAAAAAAVVCGGAAAYRGYRRANRPEPRAQPVDKKFLLPQPVVDAICGAVGEVAQIVILYPMETIKVRCQADCVGAGVVVRELLKNGWGPHVVSQLYAGLGSATAFSVVVGAIHWLTFCTAKRAAVDYMVDQERQKAAANGGRPAVPAGAVQAVTAAVHADGRVHTSAGGTAHVFPGAHEGEGAKGAKEQGEKRAGRGHPTGATHEAHKAHLHVSSGHHMHDEEVSLPAVHAIPDDLSSSAKEEAEEADVRLLATANMVGATVGAVMTALVEGPLELFRHQAQAGVISGNLFKEMSSVVRKQGPLGLYWGFLPYCFESFPYDISELATYSQLRDVYNAAVARAPEGSMFAAGSKVPSQVWDISIGAAAGSAATLISMPFDVVKTYMQTHASDAVALSAPAQVRAFWDTGVRMVQSRGPSALWVGVVPRLAQQVPSCTICWWAVEACQHFLKPYTAPA
ncbi:hypothetical protein HYH03_004614 [Edaphochlamys debaryana]|uniref:Mitochondrial carrier protein n=1 Tax=Edaphochlamys debaryana TaxID=47281 RepID=A0A835Y977_9CHLO|nr:hypothetical protein HYH03_004614 [Edaphochlamys debaryana]|eukprot:KAG2497459.1 hypothetical protein HYH03_004614 [Edaphochlamys debaryana]